jgi:hypothetical protein
MSPKADYDIPNSAQAARALQVASEYVAGQIALAFAFCETAINGALIEFSIEAEVTRRRGPTTLLRNGVEESRTEDAANATGPLNCC